MIVRWPWSLLEIEPTPDRRAIRTAYGRKLKAIDVEGDKEGFIALREAYDRALSLAAYLEAADDAPEEVPAFDERQEDAGFPGDEPPARGDDDPRFEAATVARPDPAISPLRTPPPPWRDAAIEAAEAGARALQLLLARLNDPEDPLHGTDQASLLLGHLDAVLGDPRGDTVAGFGEAEHWLERLLLGTSPASDPLIPPVAAHFGWDAREGSLALGPMATALMRRRRALEFRDAVQRRGHPLNGAWRELTRPAHARSRRGIVWGSGSVQQLLETVRQQHPSLESCFDPDRVALWEKAGKRRARAFVFVAMLVWLLFAALSLLEPALRSPSDMRTPGRTVAADAPSAPATLNLDQLVRTLSGGALTWKDLQQRNPKLADKLATLRDEARSKPIARVELTMRLRQLLDGWYFQAVLESPELVRSYQALRADQADLLKNDAKRCSSFLRNDAPYPATPGLPADLKRRQQRLLAQALLTPIGDHAPFPTRAPIPTAVAAKAQQRSGLPLARFNAVLQQAPASDAESCAARRALLRAALERHQDDIVPLLRIL